MTKADGTNGGTHAPVSTTASRLFDLRSVLALLFVVYGIILLILGLVATDEADLAKAGDWNINLWTGIVMLVLAVFFILWVRLRPVKAPVDVIDGSGVEGTAGDGTGDAAGPPRH